MNLRGGLYRARMRVLHRFNLCWMQPQPLCEGDDFRWINVWCHWCGVRGRRLDMSRAMIAQALTDAWASAEEVGW